MVNEYSLKLKNIVTQAKLLIFYWIGLIILSLFYIYVKGLSDALEFLPIYAVISIIFSSPVVTLLIQYYAVNRNIKVTVNRENQNISIFTNEVWEKFSFSDILLFEKNYSRPLFRNEEPVYPWEPLNYVKIELNNGENYYITSLIIDLFDIEISDKIIVRKSKVFPFIY